MKPIEAIIVLAWILFAWRTIDFHVHACLSCGHRWRHLGMIAGASRRAHTCSRCGSEQWWRPRERERVA